eukprot:COSAG06_NODE_1889_length_8134_cov_3.277785_3_plen_66_part_00
MITLFGSLNAELAPARAAMVSPGGGLQAIPRDALACAGGFAAGRGWPYRWLSHCGRAALLAPCGA